jgi:multidrug efflux pump subunit AcrA (membrane-fusion protein)
MIPKVAVVNEDRSNTIYIVQDSMAFKRVVELGYEENGWVEIVQGLSADETVITIGQTTLSDSARIEVISSN